MGKMKRLLWKIQEDCQHVWSDWERDGWVHDSRYCVKCNLRETKQMARGAGYGM